MTEAEELIERLNSEVLSLTDRLHWQVNENESQRKLITELADALDLYIDHGEFCSCDNCLLLLRVRELKA